MRPNEPVVYAKRGVALSLDLNRGKPTLRPFLNPLRDFDQFDSASAKDLRPALYASLLFSRHHVSPVTALTASVPLA